MMIFANLPLSRKPIIKLPVEVVHFLGACLAVLRFHLAFKWTTLNQKKIQITAQPFTSCVTLGKVFDLSLPSHSLQQKIITTSWGCLEDGKNQHV